MALLPRGWLRTDVPCPRTLCPCPFIMGFVTGALPRLWLFFLPLGLTVWWRRRHKLHCVWQGRGGESKQVPAWLSGWFLFGRLGRLGFPETVWSRAALPSPARPGQERSGMGL